MKTQLLQETVSLCVLFCVFFRKPHFCYDLGACTNSPFLFQYQFKFCVAPIDFGKPCSCLHARTCIVKIKWGHGEPEQIVKGNREFVQAPKSSQKVAVLLCCSPSCFPVGWVSTGTFSARCFFLVGSSARLVLLAPL